MTTSGSSASPSPSMRAADADRERVVTVLQEAFAQGRITVDEFQERSDQAYAAKTLGDLSPLTADLPAHDLAPASAMQPGKAVEEHRFGSGSWSPAAMAGRTSVQRRRELKAIWATWISVTTITMVIWVATCVVTTSLLPFWPVWPIGFLGAGAALRTFGISNHQHGHDRHRDRHN